MPSIKQKRNASRAQGMPPTISSRFQKPVCDLRRTAWQWDTVLDESLRVASWSNPYFVNVLSRLPTLHTTPGTDSNTLLTSQPPGSAVVIQALFGVNTDRGDIWIQRQWYRRSPMSVVTIVSGGPKARFRSLVCN